MNKISGKKVVTIGGGSGTYAMHTGLKKYVENIAAIVTMVDNGGSTGVLRDEMGVLPPGDVRKCLVALSQGNGAMRKLFTYRYRSGQLAGHSFGNLFISTLEKITGSFEEAVKEAGKILSVSGRVVPVTLDKAQLHAKLEDGQVIIGETNIDIPKHDGRLKIIDLYTKPATKITPLAKRHLGEADLIVIGPGDLYSSIGASLVVKGVVPEIRKAKAKKVYICNLMTKHGETNSFKASDFMTVLEKFLGQGVVDYVICHKKKFSPEIIKKYKKKKSEQVKIDDKRIKEMGYKLVRADIARAKRLVRHHPEDLSRTLLKILS